ncbi:galactokinase [Croceitalea sp. MTPC5]|uniref:galactokinase n=1 Tax=Croceitalea sp. MTPC5 TaxID=3056565 RepID=UPI002B3C8660|nr:galactokinase [Croceitalea sp. MTPC5]
MTTKNEIIIKSPGRINLIGEHIDYNDGFVLPAAIDKCILLRLTINGHSNRCTVKSEGFTSVLIADLNNLAKGTEGWHNYVLGVIGELQKLTDKLSGFDCTMRSTVPVGSGVSSSAALACGLAFGLNELFKLGLTKWDLIKIGQRTEHDYVGTKCGIMDQFASVMGKEGHFMLLDCRSLAFQYVATELGDYRMLLLNTNVSHNLSDGEYNIRREQCEKGLDILVKRFNIDRTFRKVTSEMLLSIKTELGPLLFNRCSYVIEEIKRVQKAARELKNGNLESVGMLMYESHEGLAKKYEVSCDELDFLVELSKNEPELLGSRMMGGGFGGCTLNLIHKDAIDDFVKKAAKAYKKSFNINLNHFQTQPSEGTAIISNF